MILRKKLKKFLIPLLIILILFIFINNQIKNSNLKESAQFLYKQSINSSYSNKFNLNTDVLVFVHIQKTGGSNFDRYIIKNLLYKDDDYKWKQACTLKSTLIDRSQKKKKFKKFACKRKNSHKGEPNWYFSRQTFGWICGLHADYSELKICVPKFYKDIDNENIKYFTILRDPVKRYISEWKHVAKGATWKRHKDDLCFKINECYKDNENWANVTLKEFMACSLNPGNNRQTRMLAQFTDKFNFCNEIFDREDFDRELFKRAKATLDSFVYFALNEYHHLSKVLFERQFAERIFKFKKDVKQFNQTTADDLYQRVSPEVLRNIERINHLDRKLYSYAVELFFQRLKFYDILF